MEVFERIFITDDTACRKGDSEWAVVHACKSPCHQREIGYKGSRPQDHPHYLYLEKENDLFLNIIDPPVPLFKPVLFQVFLSFAKKHWESGQKLLIHCNKGESRSPSLALLFLAKCRGAISNQSYAAAAAGFRGFYYKYQPGKGIQAFLTQHWDALNGC